MSPGQPNPQDVDELAELVFERLQNRITSSHDSSTTVDQLYERLQHRIPAGPRSTSGDMDLPPYELADMSQR
jgi:hypothetical protein